MMTTRASVTVAIYANAACLLVFFPTYTAAETGVVYERGSETFASPQAACKSYIETIDIYEAPNRTMVAATVDEEGVVRCTWRDKRTGDSDWSYVARASEPLTANPTAETPTTTTQPSTQVEPAGGKNRKKDCPPIDYRLQPRGALRSAAREVHDLADMYPSDVKTAKGLKSPRGRTQTTVALSEVELADTCRVVYGAASGGNLSPRQKRALSEYKVRIVGGKGHAEMNIRDKLPTQSHVIRWGISWAANQRPDPCSECAPELKRLGGVIETD